MGERRAVTNRLATMYRRATKAGKSVILDDLVELTSWHRDQGRAQIRQSETVRVVALRAVRNPGVSAKGGVRFGAVLAGGALSGREALAPRLAVLVLMLRSDGEFDLSDDEAALLMAMSPATIDRRVQGTKVLARFAARSHAKPGSLLKSQIPIRTWSEWDDATPRSVEIDLFGHDGGGCFREFCLTLTNLSEH